MDLIDRQDALEAICTWDKFGVDGRGRVVRWHEGLEPYVHLRDVVWAIENMPSAQPEIIRCKDCNNASKCYGYVVMRSIGGGNIYCHLEFCSAAERRTDE